MKLCVALDLESKEKCLNLANELSGLDLWLKVGLRSYLRDGIALIAELKKREFKVFLDLKIYDIPNTTADACEVATDSGADMINIHSSAGKSALETAMNRLNARRERPLVLGVSVLTSFSQSEFTQIYNSQIADAALNMSQIAFASGLDGMVCSVYESLAIKAATSDKFLTLTPGIRPFGENSDDQARIANLDVARKNKSDFIVVGRPIYKAENPREIAEKILRNLNSF